MVNRERFTLCLLIFFLFGACQKEDATLFELVPSNKSNITFTNALKPNSTLNILDYLYYYNGGGVAIGDINKDGLADVFFTGNQVENKLYLNKGNFEFEDITAKAGLEGSADWNTGATMVDVNGDGWLDIYVCAVSGINGLEGKNELFINTGDLSFTEQAEEYGLAFKNYSTQAAFFDYDQDGDLDMYLLNHAVHTAKSYGLASIREERIPETGDKLLRNDGNQFVDVSEAAGIYGGVTGYGLGVCTADFNNDGFVDVYISNDFHEDDFYYVNNGDGTFTESIKKYFGHTSRFSMGSDASDVNNDGYYDLLTLDMMPASEEVLKASTGEDNVDIHQLKVDKLGYHHQYARNMLQINQKAEAFTEVALYSGIAATDWSWSPLFADFDLDGCQDLFISNGIPKRPNDLDYIKYISSIEIKQQLQKSNKLDQEVLNQMPSGAYQNFIYQGTATMQFIDRTADWLPQNNSISNGSAYADLDNDGDLDLVTNNTNASPFIYENTQTTSNHYLKLKLNDSPKNRFGIGSKAVVYQNGKRQYKQLFTTKGFQSSSEPLLHFGFESGIAIDSILIIWTDNSLQVLKNIPLDTSLNITKANTKSADLEALFSTSINPLFTKKTTNFGIDFSHQDNNFIDFKREGLLPYKLSDRSRAMIVGDINNDGKADVFFGGSKFQAASIYLQKEEGFFLQKDSTIQADAKREDVDVLLENLDNKAGNDLFVVSGGGEFSGKSKALLDRYYQNDGNGNFSSSALPEYFENASVVKAADIDQDGDLDLFVGGRAVVNKFGSSPNSYLLENTQEGFKLIENPALQKVGMVTDAIFSDFDTDGDEDLIVVGEWMAPTFFQNNEGKLEKISKVKEQLNGLWQTIAPFDADGDGDMDYVLGNWGLNSKYTASASSPLLMYYGDVDDNGQSESIIALEKEGQYYSFNNLDELAQELTMLRKKFTSYRDFAGKTLEEVFGTTSLKKLAMLKVNELASGYLRKDEDRFVFVPFEAALQLAPITSLLVHDFSNNDRPDLLMAGNYMGVAPNQGRFDGFVGALWLDDGTVLSGIDVGMNLGQKQVCKMETITIRQKKYVLVMVYNSPIELYEVIQ